MSRNMIIALALAVATACGGNKDSDSKPEADHHEHEMENMSPALARFHDLLAPLWHAPPGTARVQSTCEAIGDFKKRAADVPNAQDLTAAIGELEKVCIAKGSDKDFDAAFGKVHDAFHHALEAGHAK